MVMLENIIASTNATNMRMRLRQGSTSITNSNYFSAYNGVNYAGAGFSVYTSSGAYFTLPQIASSGGGGGGRLSGNINFFNIGDGGTNGNFTSSMFSTLQGACYGGGEYAANTTMDGLLFYVGTGTFTGTISLYGMAKA